MMAHEDGVSVAFGRDVTKKIEAEMCCNNCNNRCGLMSVPLTGSGNGKLEMDAGSMIEDNCNSIMI